MPKLFLLDIFLKKDFHMSCNVLVLTQVVIEYIVGSVYDRYREGIFFSISITTTHYKLFILGPFIGICVLKSSIKYPDQKFRILDVEKIRHLNLNPNDLFNCGRTHDAGCKIFFSLFD